MERPDGWKRTESPRLTLRPALVHLYAWAEVFRHELKLGIPAAPILIAPLPPDRSAQFDSGVSESGLAYVITLDEARLLRRHAQGEWTKVLATLLHEQLHLWQLVRGTWGDDHHDFAFRAKALSCGLVISERGVTVSHVRGGPFLSLLSKQGVRVPTIRGGLR